MAKSPQETILPSLTEVGVSWKKPAALAIVQDTVVSSKDAVSIVVVPARQKCLYVPEKIGNVECQMIVETGTI